MRESIAVEFQFGYKIESVRARFSIIYPLGYDVKRMAHTIEEKKKLLNRIRRIRGQVEAIERSLQNDEECSVTLHSIAACRGAMDALMAEVVEGHIRYHVVDPRRRSAEQAKAADDVIAALKTYLR